MYPPWIIQENLRRLLSANDASSDFNSWCKQELKKFNTDVDGKQTIPHLSHALYSTVVTIVSVYVLFSSHIFSPGMGCPTTGISTCMVGSFRGIYSCSTLCSEAPITVHCTCTSALMTTTSPHYAYNLYELLYISFTCIMIRLLPPPTLYSCDICEFPAGGGLNL